MSRDKQDETQKWKDDYHILLEKYGDLNHTLVKTSCRLNEMQKELQDTNEKYCLLLERHIKMMERTVKLNEQRETD